MTRVFLSPITLITLLSFTIANCGDGGNPVNQRSDDNAQYIKDGRDGKTYKWMSKPIGDKIWMLEHLNYKTKSGSWCYGNDKSNCDRYGRLYDKNTALKACPAGSQLPSPQDWSALANAVGDDTYTQGKGLKAKNGWAWNDEDNKDGNGTDVVGFSALPGGSRGSNGKFHDIGYHGAWWTTQLGTALSYNRDIIYGGFGMVENSGVDKEGLSVRCVITVK
jgi:uncharacterized protein (TIGR02145 family)